MLTFRPIKKCDKSYALALAKKEIGIEAKRLDRYKTFLIYNAAQRIGFVSFGFRSDKTIYLYILAFEKHAQRQGFAAEVFTAVTNYGRKKGCSFKGLTCTVHKYNDAALNAVAKHGFLVERNRHNYFDFIKPVSCSKENQL